jgi:hypothetical protein
MRIDERPDDPLHAVDTPGPPQRLQRFDQDKSLGAGKQGKRALMHILHRRSHARQVCRLDHGRPHADAELERVDDVDWGGCERVPRSHGVLNDAAEAAEDMDRYNGSRSIAECR